MLKKSRLAIFTLTRCLLSHAWEKHFTLLPQPTLCAVLVRCGPRGVKQGVLQPAYMLHLAKR